MNTVPGSGQAMEPSQTILAGPLRSSDTVLLSNVKLF